MTTSTAPAVSPRTRVALAFLILVACLLAASTWRTYSNTWDEPEHLAAGIELLDKGRYEYDTEHPPIVRIFMALGPYLAGARSFGTPPPDGVQEGVDILYSGGHYTLYLTLARLGTLPFLALLLYATWLWARRLASSAGEALLGVLLLASVPAVLGHAALATLDVAAAGTVLLALYALQCWLTSARWRDAIFFGVASGVAVGSKFSAVPFLALGFGVLALAHAVVAWRARPTARQHWWPDRNRWSGFAVILLMTLVPLALVYGIRSPSAASFSHRFEWAVVFLQHEHGLSHDAGVFLGHLWLPQWVQGLLEGIIAIKAHNDSGHLSFLLGELRSTGWWYFYLVVLAVKTPIPLLVTGPIGMVMLAVEGWRKQDAWRLAPLLSFLTVLVFSSCFSHINIGVRHVLVLYPFMALGAAYVLASAWRAWHGAAVRAVVVVLVLWQVSTLWTANPDYLPYFNEAVDHPERVLVDSDLDWGQDLWRLEQRAAAMKIPSLNLAYRGTADLAREPLPHFVILPPWQQVTGWIAISELAKVHDPKGYAWLEAYRPIERVGKTIDLYYIPGRR